MGNVPLSLGRRGRRSPLLGIFLTFRRGCGGGGGGRRRGSGGGRGIFCLVPLAPGLRYPGRGEKGRDGRDVGGKTVEVSRYRVVEVHLDKEDDGGDKEEQRSYGRDRDEEEVLRGDPRVVLDEEGDVVDNFVHGCVSFKTAQKGVCPKLQRYRGEGGCKRFLRKYLEKTKSLCMFAPSTDGECSPSRN